MSPGSDDSRGKLNPRSIRSSCSTSRSMPPFRTTPCVPQSQLSHPAASGRTCAATADSDRLLVLRRLGGQDPFALAESLWMVVAPHGWARVAATLLDGSPTERRLRWERALDCDEVLRHPCNETLHGVLLPRSQCVRSKSPRRAFSESVHIAKSLSSTRPSC